MKSTQKEYNSPVWSFKSIISETSATYILAAMMTVMLIKVILKNATRFFLSKRTITILFTNDAVGVSRDTITAYIAASDVVKNYKENKTAMVHKPQRIRLPRSINCLPKPRGYATECK